MLVILVVLVVNMDDVVRMIMVVCDLKVWIMGWFLGWMMVWGVLFGVYFIMV